MQVSEETCVLVDDRCTGSVKIQYFLVSKKNSLDSSALKAQFVFSGQVVCVKYQPY